MSPDAQRIAIAEACITRFSCCRCQKHDLEPVPAKLFKYGAPFCSDECAERASDWTLEDGQSDIPNYLNDLNACHEMEKGLTQHQRIVYKETLCEITPCDPAVSLWGLTHATATQRAEAFLRATNLWTT